jgi:hypothetical protein
MYRAGGRLREVFDSLLKLIKYHIVDEVGIGGRLNNNNLQRYALGMRWCPLCEKWLRKGDRTLARYYLTKAARIRIKK